MRAKAMTRNRRGPSPSEIQSLYGYRASGTTNAFRSSVPLHPRQVADYRTPTPAQRVLRHAAAMQGARQYGNERLLREIGGFIGSFLNAKSAPKNMRRR